MAQTDKQLKDQAPVSDLQAEIEKLKAENEALKAASVPRGMTVPREAKHTTIIHQPDPKTKEPIASTVRTDYGFDPNQKFNGRQP